MDPVLEVSSSEDSEAYEVIGQGLNRFNDAVLGYTDRRPLFVLVREAAGGAVVGGISGRTSLGLLLIDLVFLPEQARGRGVGARMMGMAEAEARRRGCRAGVLFTISFQAPGFYQKLGWRVFGEVACDPPGTSRVFLSKTFE